MRHQVQIATTATKIYGLMRLPVEASSLKTVQFFFSGCLGLEMHLNSANTFIVDLHFYAYVRALMASRELYPVFGQFLTQSKFECNCMHFHGCRNNLLQ